MLQYKSLNPCVLYKVVNFFLSVAKDLAIRWTDMILLYNEASFGFTEGF